MEMPKLPLLAGPIYHGIDDTNAILLSTRVYDADGNMLFEDNYSSHASKEYIERQQAFLFLTAKTFNLQADLLNLLASLKEWYGPKSLRGPAPDSAWDDTGKTWEEHVNELCKKAGVA